MHPARRAPQSLSFGSLVQLNTPAAISITIVGNKFRTKKQLRLSLISCETDTSLGFLFSAQKQNNWSKFQGLSKSLSRYAKPVPSKVVPYSIRPRWFCISLASECGSASHTDERNLHFGSISIKRKPSAKYSVVRVHRFSRHWWKRRGNDGMCPSQLLAQDPSSSMPNQ